MVEAAAMFTLEDIQDLIFHKRKNSVSLYMPIHDRGVETKQDPIRLRKLRVAASREMAAAGVDNDEAGLILRRFDDKVTGLSLRQHDCRGLAVFADADTARSVYLPDAPEETVVVHDVFHLIPLLRVAKRQLEYFILALRQKGVKLYRCTPSLIEDVTPPGTPPTIEQGLMLELAERGVQFKSGGSAVTEGRPGTYHGEGDGVSDSKSRIREYFNLIDTFVFPVLREPAPLVTAGLSFERALFREVSTYPYLVKEGIDGHWEADQIQELHDRAWAIIEPTLDTTRELFSEEFGRRRGHLKDGITTHIREALPQAREGKMRALFILESESLWGRFDGETGEIRIHRMRQPGDTDLGNLAAIETLVHRGDVFVVPREQMPESGTEIAGVLRY